MANLTLIEVEELVLVGVYKVDGEYAELYQVQGERAEIFNGGAYEGDIIYEGPFDNTLYILDSTKEAASPLRDEDATISVIKNGDFGDILGYILLPDCVRVYNSHAYQDREFTDFSVDTGVWNELEEGVVIDD